MMSDSIAKPGLLTVQRRELLRLTAATLAYCLYESGTARAQTIVVTGNRKDEDDGGKQHAPHIALESNNAYPPRIDIDLDESYMVGDALQLQAASTSAFASPIIDVTVPIDASTSQAIVAALGTIRAPAQTLFRVRGIRGAEQSPWSNLVKHGDSVAPKITSSAAPRFPENAPVAHMLTADKDVRWTLLPSADASMVELRGGKIIQLIGNANPDFEQKQSYDLTIRATDLSGNSSVQNLLIRITDVEESSASTWGTAIKGTYVTLSNDNLTATGNRDNVGAACRVRATNARKGRKYFEIHIDEKSSNKNFVGLCSSLVNIPGQFDGVGTVASEGACLSGDGTVLHNGTAEMHAALAFASGDTVMIAFDATSRMIWFGKNGVWEGKPALGTGGFSMGPTEDFYAFASVCAMLGGPNSVTANFGAKPFAFPMPGGFAKYI